MPEATDWRGHCPERKAESWFSETCTDCPKRTNVASPTDDVFKPGCELTTRPSKKDPETGLTMRDKGGKVIRDKIVKPTEFYKMTKFVPPGPAAYHSIWGMNYLCPKCTHVFSPSVFECEYQDEQGEWRPFRENVYCPECNRDVPYKSVVKRGWFFWGLFRKLFKIKKRNPHHEDHGADSFG